MAIQNQLDIDVQITSQLQAEKQVRRQYCETVHPNPQYADEEKSNNYHDLQNKQVKC